MDQAIQSTLSLANDTHSVRDHGSRFPPPFIKHGPISPLSRPLSTSTVTSNKQLPQLPPSTTIPTPRPAMNPAHVTSDPDQQKPRKKTFFGMITLPTSRRSSVSKSHPTSPRSPTPDNTFSSLHQRDLDPPAPSLPKYHDLTPIPLNDATNYRWDGDVPGQRSQPSFEISEPDSGLGIETIVAKTKLVTIVSPRPHSNSAHDAHIRPSSTPPRVGNGVNRSKRVSIEEPDRPRQPDPTPSGRISPLTAFANPKVLGGRKGKEREGDPDRAKDPRKNTPVPTSENEKGRDSRNSKRNTTNISGPMKINGRTKHGSFDFERPLSASVHPVRTARLSTSGPYRVSTESQRNATPRGNGHLWNAPNPSTYPIQEERSTLTRSQSVRESDLERTQPKIRFTDETKDPRSRSRNQHDPRSRTQQQPNHSSPPQKSAPQLPYRPEGGSWGRRTSPRPGLGGAAHPNGLPSFGTSVTSLQLGGNATRPPPRSDSPQILTLPTDRYGEKWKNRSLDLGLELNWAPSRVKGEAVMDFREVGVRPRWREEAEAKEFDRWKVLEPFGSVLGESDYAKFIECAFPSGFFCPSTTYPRYPCSDVQRFDSRLMSLDGQSGLIHKVKRLLDTSAKNLGAERKRELLEVLERVLQHS